MSAAGLIHWHYCTEHIGGTEFDGGRDCCSHPVRIGDALIEVIDSDGTGTPVVQVWGATGESVALNPGQAREMSAQLLRLADLAERAVDEPEPRLETRLGMPMSELVTRIGAALS